MRKALAKKRRLEGKTEDRRVKAAHKEDISVMAVLAPDAARQAGKALPRLRIKAGDETAERSVGRRIASTRSSGGAHISK